MWNTTLYALNTSKYGSLLQKDAAHQLLALSSTTTDTTVFFENVQYSTIGGISLPEGQTVQRRGNDLELTVAGVPKKFIASNL